MFMENTTDCPNCNTPFVGPFCHSCGEKKRSHHDFTITHFLKELFEKFTHLDSKLIRAVWLLIAKPGFLTVEYIRGKRVPYEKPLPLFLIINVLYFLSIGINQTRTFETPLDTQLRNPYSGVVKTMLYERFHGDTAAVDAYAPVFNEQNHTLSKSMLLLIAPFIACLTAVLYRRKKMYFGEHLVTGIHFLALMLVQNMVVGILLKGSLFYSLFGPFPYIGLIMELVEPAMWTILLSWLTFKTVFKEGMGITALKAFLFSIAWFVVLIIYRFIVFWVTFYTTG